MSKTRQKRLNKFNPLFLGVIIVLVISIGSIWYLNNYSNQIRQTGKVEFAEFRLNELNDLYINYLKAIRDNRGYRLYQLENREKDYHTHKSKVFSLLESFRLSPEYPQDSILFSEIRQLIYLRFNDLDQQLMHFNSDRTHKRSQDELQTMDSLINLLEQKQQALIDYWSKESKLASDEFDRNNEGNDELFLLWIIGTLTLATFFIFIYRRNVKAQIREAVTQETLTIIKQKEREFSAAFDYASIGMALVSTQGKWLRVNKSLCHLLGYSEEELLKLSFQDITHPDDLSTDLQFVEQMLRQEIDTYQMEKRYFTKEERLIWVLLSVSLVWEKGKPKHFISQIQEITTRKNLQDQLYSEKIRLQQVIDGTGAGTWEWNVQTGETIFNEKWANIIGYSLEELKPTDINTWIKFAHPEDLEASNQRLQDCFQKRSEIYECACRMKHRSGEWVWVMDRGKVMTWTPDGKPEWMFGSHIEITAMKQLEESLVLERNKFTTIFNSTFQFIGFLTLDGTLLETNETALTFGGLIPSDVIGKKFWDCHWWQINKETQEQLKEAVQKAAKGESVNYEVAIWDKDKNPVTILFNLKPLKNQEGKVVFLIPEGTLIQDLIDYRTKLESKNQELEDFAAIAAHDLKEPLRMISLFLDKLSKKYETDLDETGKKYIRFAVDGAERMKTLINDLLAYAEIGGVGEASFEQVNLNMVFDETVALNAAILDEKNAEVSKSELPIVWGHKTAFKLLFQNLIGNGLKYQPIGNQPVIKVSSIENEKEFTLVFTDNGIGISEENQPKVFNLFSRLHTKSEYPGTGMGLATCKKIIDLHGGQIWVKSTLGNGSVFHFTLPNKKLIA